MALKGSKWLKLAGISVNGCTWLQMPVDAWKMLKMAGYD